MTVFPRVSQNLGPVWQQFYKEWVGRDTGQKYALIKHIIVSSPIGKCVT